MLQLHVTMFCDVDFMYRLYHDCARTLKRSLVGELAIVELSGDFACNFSKHPCTLASFSHACMPRSACAHDVTCELLQYCIQGNIILQGTCSRPIAYTKPLPLLSSTFLCLQAHG